MKHVKIAANIAVAIHLIDRAAWHVQSSKRSRRSRRTGDEEKC